MLEMLRRLIDLLTLPRRHADLLRAYSALWLAVRADQIGRRKRDEDAARAARHHPRGYEDTAPMHPRRARADADLLH